jgi:hypothetical protein
MITDHQFRRLMKLSQTEETLALAAAKAGMDEKTARKWRKMGLSPSEAKKPRTYRTRPDPFAEVWEEVEQLLEGEPSLEAKTKDIAAAGEGLAGTEGRAEGGLLYARARSWPAGAE